MSVVAFWSNRTVMIINLRSVFHRKLKIDITLWGVGLYTSFNNREKLKIKKNRRLSYEIGTHF
jgi:hypothetical protein